MKHLEFKIMAVVFAAIGGYMIYADKDHWGWLIFASLLCVVVPIEIELKPKSKKTIKSSKPIKQ